MYKTKVDIVYEYLLEGIKNGKFEPGSRLVISQISKECDVSDIPVREAIRRLESEGYVHVSANQGAVVYQFTPELIDEIVQIRAVLEGYATRLAVDVLTEEEYAHLHKINNDLRQNLASGNLERVAQLNVQFHMFIYQKLPQRELCSMISALWEKHQITRRIFQLDPDRGSFSYDEHEKMLALMAAKEYEEVERYTRRHKLSAGRDLINSLTKTKQP